MVTTDGSGLVRREELEAREQERDTGWSAPFLLITSGSGFLPKEFSLFLSYLPLEGQSLPLAVWSPVHASNPSHPWGACVPTDHSYAHNRTSGVVEECQGPGTETVCGVSCVLALMT